jgi:hypothetical protein
MGGLRMAAVAVLAGTVCRCLVSTIVCKPEPDVAVLLMLMPLQSLLNTGATTIE